MCTCPSGEGVWALPPAASDAASAQLVAFPEWTAAEAALDAGKPGAALPELQRVVEVTTSMGPASPMAIAAQKRYAQRHEVQHELQILHSGYPLHPQAGCGGVFCQGILNREVQPCRAAQCLG